MLYFKVFMNYTLIGIFPLLPETSNVDEVKLNVTAVPVLTPITKVLDKDNPDN